MKNAQSKIKAIKTGREIGTMYCLRCTDYTDKIESQIKCLEKNQTVLFVDLVNQDFLNKSTTTKNNSVI